MREGRGKEVKRRGRKKRAGGRGMERDREEGFPGREECFIWERQQELRWLMGTAAGGEGRGGWGEMER